MRGHRLVHRDGRPTRRCSATTDTDQTKDLRLWGTLGGWGPSSDPGPRAGARPGSEDGPQPPSANRRAEVSLRVRMRSRRRDPGHPEGWRSSHFWSVFGEMVLIVQPSG